MTDDIGDRVTRLETKQDMILEDFKEHAQREDKDRTLILSQLEAIRNDLTRQKGFWAGVALVVSGIITVISTGLIKVFHQP